MTKNNPDESIDEFADVVKRTGAVQFAGQLEKGEKCGTPHFQCFIGYHSQRSVVSVRKQLVGCDVRVSKNAFKCYEYCTKVETRLSPPVTFGPIPRPPRRAGQDTKSYNELVLSKRLTDLVDTGAINIGQLGKLAQSKNLY